MRLHKDQSRPGGRRGQFFRHSGAAVFLLRGGHQQHVAVRQYLSQTSKIIRRFPAYGVLERYFGCIGIGAIHQHQLAEQGQIAYDQLNARGIDAQHFRSDIGTADKRGPASSGTLTSDLYNLRP